MSNNEMKYKYTDKWSGSRVAGGLYNKNEGGKTAERYYSDLDKTGTILSASLVIGF